MCLQYNDSTVSRFYTQNVCKIVVIYRVFKPNSYSNVKWPLLGVWNTWLSKHLLYNTCNVIYFFLSVIRDILLDICPSSFSVFLLSKPLSLVSYEGCNVPSSKPDADRPEKLRRTDGVVARVKGLEDNRSVNALLDIYIDNEIWHGPTQPAHFGAFY